MANRNILVVGATGKQGGAVINALLNFPSNTTTIPFHILAVTRNTHSEKARSFASNQNITVVQGGLTIPSSIFEAHQPIYGVFCVTVPGKAGDEEKQAKSVIDAAIANNVQHFIFSSVDRGGPGVSDTNPTQIPHFASKHHIEEYLKDKAGTKMTWTILRPAAFMDNMAQGFMAKAFSSMWSSVGDKPLQMVSCRDLGVFAAKAFADPEKYKGAALSLAGSELNVHQGRKVFRQTIGSDMPETWGFVGSGIRTMNGDLGSMFKWFRTNGYGADIEALRKDYPELQDFAKWLKESSDFKKQ